MRAKLLLPTNIVETIESIGCALVAAVLQGCLSRVVLLVQFLGMQSAKLGVRKEASIAVDSKRINIVDEP